MSKRKTIFIISIFILTGALVFWKLSDSVSKQTRNVRGIMTERLNFVSSINTNVDKYISELEFQIQQNPNSSSLYNKLGAAYLQKARESGEPSFYSKAEDYLNSSIEANPKNFEAMYLMGTLCLAKHQFNRALGWGIRATDLNPHNAPVMGVIFDAQIELGKYDEALNTLQTMIDTRPDLSSYSRVSYYRELIGDTRGAIDAMKSAINAGAPHSENTAWCRVQLGNLYLNNGEPDKAENEYNLALIEFPKFYQALSALGRLHLIKNNKTGAIELYKMSLESNPSAEAMIALGDLYRITGQNEKAEEQYQNVRFVSTLLKESGVETDMELALFEADHNSNLDKSLKDAEESVEKNPTIKSYNTLAWIQYKTGNYSEAEKNIVQALRLGTKEPLLYFHAGMIYQKLGQNQNANAYLDYALKINPSFSEIYE